MISNKQTLSIRVFGEKDHQCSKMRIIKGFFGVKLPRNSNSQKLLRKNIMHDQYFNCRSSFAWSTFFNNEKYSHSWIFNFVNFWKVYFLASRFSMKNKKSILFDVAPTRHKQPGSDIRYIIYQVTRVRSWKSYQQTYL